MIGRKATQIKEMPQNSSVAGIGKGVKTGHPPYIASDPGPVAKKPIE